MRFRKILFKNYRCFLDGTLSFSESKDRNINILIGPNGGGKTETLFAFWWALYGFDFTTLRAKENTPYALNAMLYRKLENSPSGSQNTCSVSIEFEENNVVYLVTRRCDYRKTDKRITPHEYQELSYYNNKGELSIPIRNTDEIAKQLARIIPRSILYGIIFDGERMQKLSATDDNSKNAIKGVISDITNVDLLERCITYFKSIKTTLTNTLRQYATKAGSTQLSDLIEAQLKTENELSQEESLLESETAEKESKEKRLSEISTELQNNEIAKGLEIERAAEITRRDELASQLDTLYKDFSASLKNAYLIVSTELLSDTESIIQKYDVPEDLTVKAVQSILKRPKCICGHELHQDEIKTLNELLLSLPPDNINSTLAEMIRQLKDRVEEIKAQAVRSYNLVDNAERAISESKKKIVRLSNEISELKDSEDAERAKLLEIENQDILKRLAVLENNIPNRTKHIAELKKEKENLIEKRDAKSQHEENERKINSQLAFIQKCEWALGDIREINKDKALSLINEKIGEAYQLLSEDAALGREIRIIQYDNTRRYQIVVYIKNACDRLLQEWKNSGQYNAYITAGKSEEEIFEMAVLKNIDPNSTGQSKMNTFAFVKAILDYSNLPKNEDGIEIKKEYPLLIDAPFGDISGENLDKSSENLYRFTKQVILMLDETHYETLRNKLDCHVSNVYRFVKQDKKNCSIIQKSK